MAHHRLLHYVVNSGGPNDLRKAMSGGVALLWHFVWGNNGLGSYVLDRAPVNDGYPQLFIGGIFDDSFHVQLFTVQGETHAIAQHNLPLGQTLYGAKTVQAQVALLVRIMEVDKYFWLVHVVSPPNDCLQVYETAMACSI
jgi:hypothetical protein